VNVIHFSFEGSFFLRVRITNPLLKGDPECSGQIVTSRHQPLEHIRKIRGLTKVGLDWNLVLSLPPRSGACRESQSIWIKERNTRQEAEQEWKDQAPAAFGLRDQLIHDFRFAFRKFDGLLARVEEIAQGDTNSDMVQDLNDLAVLGKSNTDLLAAINFDLTLLDLAADLSDRMGDLLGATNGERKKDSEAMLIRDKAFTYLKQAVDEIRECGKFAFWHTPDRLKGYNSDYWKQQKVATAKATPTAGA